MSLLSFLGRTFTLRDRSFWTFFGGGQTWAGKSVTPDGVLQIATALACIRLTSTTVSTLPLHVYRERPDGSRERLPDDAASMSWVKIDPAGAREFDVLMFCRGGLESHAGLVCLPGRMLHIDAGQHSEITSFVTGRWAPRLAGVYRHRARVGVMEA